MLIASLGVILGIGIPLFVAAVLALVFTLVSRSNAQRRAALEQEGIVMDSGPQWITVHFNNFHAPGFYRGAGVTKTRGSLVLTQKQLAMFPSRRGFFHVPRSGLSRFSVGIGDGGGLQLHSDDPPGATGSIDYRVQLSDAPAWVKALTDAGAKAR